MLLHNLSGPGEEAGLLVELQQMVRRLNARLPFDPSKLFEVVKNEDGGVGIDPSKQADAFEFMMILFDQISGDLQENTHSNMRQ